MTDIIQYEQTIYQLIPRETSVDRFIELWLHDRPETTQQVYKADAYRFLFFLEDKPLNQVILSDLQDFADTLSYLKPASKGRILKAVKSLFSFAEKTGYLPLNVGAAVRLPKTKRRLAERILSEEQVHRIIDREENPRNHLLLRFLYISGARVSEVCKLTWRDFQDRDFGMGQVILDGKGDKERTVLLPESLYADLQKFRKQQAQHFGQEIGENVPVFLSSGGRRYKGTGHLDPSQVHRVVEEAAIRANVQTYIGEQRRKNRKTKLIEVKQVKKSRVSPHFFRHAHASHALDRGVPPHVVQATLGHASLATTTVYSHARPDTSSALKLSA